MLYKLLGERSGLWNLKLILGLFKSKLFFFNIDFVTNSILGDRGYSVLSSR